MGKKELRERYKKELKNIKNRKEREKDMVSSILMDERISKASVISIFVSFGDEINTILLIEGLLKKGLRVAVPSIGLNDELSMKEIKSIEDLEISGLYGIKEPNSSCLAISKNEISIIIVPGLAFDEKGYRLGRGKGYYDRYLRNSNLKTIGIGFKEQFIDNLPSDKWDVPIDDVMLF